MVDELYMLPALDLVALYRARKVSPVEVCEAVFSHIGQINPILNAFQFLDEPFVRAAAVQSEERWRHGEPQGLLDGVPVTVKDNLLTAGWPSLSGSRTINPKQQWSEDAPGVARLREHGAILIGKTTMPEFAWKVMTDSPLFGITRNPFNIDRTPGGSSGGAASATASGMGTLALATDGGGSIRVPASRCGLVGLKPTHGRVSDYPPSRFGTNSHVGPITRSARDAWSTSTRELKVAASLIALTLDQGVPCTPILPRSRDEPHSVASILVPKLS
jgi:aspartyl-tRNA(Asn)/glutamyl-tRNA(Gln) amidotransferase subunit A